MLDNIKLFVLTERRS